MKKAVFLGMILLMGLCSGCSAAQETTTAIQAQGRDYGQNIELAEGDTMSTAFFDMTVNSASLASEIDGYVPINETDQFLVVNITVTNTFDSEEPLPMIDADFELEYLSGEETVSIFPESQFAADQLPASYDIEQGGSQTGNLIYVVPSDASDFRIFYYDLWDDDFEGNSFWLPFSITG